MVTNKNEGAWQSLFDKYDILKIIEKQGHYKISSKDINIFRESRLMTKFDHSANLPKLFADNNLTILPITRGDYLIGNFDAYFSLKYGESIKPKTINAPIGIESIDFNNIYSEATALNSAYISGILSDVLGEDCLPTVSGRMSTQIFDFQINDKVNQVNHKINVNNSQCEIDGGYESENYFMLVEAKNYRVTDFLIRQLYYPYRLWSGKVKKTVKPVFFTYSNSIYDFFMFDFKDSFDYNSLELVARKSFIIKSDIILIDEIKAILDSTQIVTEPDFPFPQADSFQKVIDLLNLLSVKDLSKKELSLEYDFDIRQSAYYFSALQYLGLVDKIKIENETYFTLNTFCRHILNQSYKPKYLEIVKLILKHPVFNKSLISYFECNGNLSQQTVIEIMKNSELFHINKDSSTIERRSKTVTKWIEWIIELTRI